MGAFDSAEFMEFNNGAPPYINEANLLLLQKTMMLCAHPVGSYYWSSDDTDPSELFGGTWTRIKDVFLYALGDTGDAGDTGGNTSHNLDITGIYAKINPTGAGMNYSNAGKSFVTDYYLDGGSFTKAYGGRENSNAGTNIDGTLSSGDNLPPYIKAYCWRRTA